MLLPMGPMSMDMNEEPPAEVRGKHCNFWWVLLGLFLGLFVLQILAIDIFGAVFTGIMAVIVWYMVANRCLQMTQYCLFMFGLLCVIQAVFETITLLTMVGGRRIQHTTQTQSQVASGKTTSVTLTTVIEQHDFFDSSMGFRYNVQSAMRICSPAVMTLAGLMAYWSYNAFPNGLFSYQQEDSGLLGGGRMGGGADYGGPYRGDRTGGGGGQSIEGGRVVNAGRQQQFQPPRLFEGSGQRLGGK